MKTLLKQIFAQSATIGPWRLYAYSDGTLTARRDGSGLMAPAQSPTLAGLKRLLAFIDEN